MSVLSNIDLITRTLDDLSVGVGIFHIPDLDNARDIRYVFMNKVLLYEMRKSRDEVFGKKIIEVAPEAYEHEGGLMVIDTYRKVASEGGVVNLGLVEYSNLEVAGTYECTIHQLEKHYVYVQLRNVTRLEKAKLELEEKYELEKRNKALEEFVHLTSHDLQEPLNSILGFSNLLKKELDTAEPNVQKSLELISGSAQRMKNYIIELQELSRLGRTSKKEYISVEKLIKNVKVDLDDLLKNQQAKVSYVGKDVNIFGYKSELHKLFQNLISNAVKFTEDGVKPVVLIDLEEDAENFIFSISDNGIGIEEKHFETIFKVFQRLHLKKHYPGTGMGLAYCQKIISLHNGKIWLNSKRGVGSTFYCSIPKTSSN